MRHALLHVAKAKAALLPNPGKASAFFETVTIIRNRHTHPAASTPEFDPHLAGAGMALDVVQRFLGNPVERRACFGLQSVLAGIGL